MATGYVIDGLRTWKKPKAPLCIEPAKICAFYKVEGSVAHGDERDHQTVDGQAEVGVGQ